MIAKITLTVSIMLAFSLLPVHGWAQSEKQGIALRNEAGRLQDKARSRQDMEKALEKYEQALRIFERTRSEKIKGRTLNDIGEIYRFLGEYQKALEYFEKSLAISQKLREAKDEAASLNNAGIVYRSLGEYQKALDYYEKSLAISQKLRNVPGEVATLGNMGRTYYFSGQFEKALECYQKQLNIASKAVDVKQQGVAYRNIGEVNQIMGQLDKALEHYDRALIIMQKLGDVAMEGAILDAIGQLYSSWGQYQKALEYHQMALTIQQRLGNVPGEACTLNGMGTVYYNWAQYQKALDYFEKCLAIQQKLGDVVAEASILNNLGAVFAQMGKPQEALVNYEKSLEILTKKGLRTEGTKALIGNLCLDMNDMEKAEKFITESQSDGYMGRLYLVKSDFQAAKGCFEKVVDYAEKSRDANNLFVAYTGLGRVYEALEDYKTAEQYYDKGMKLIEEIRSGLMPAERKNFFEAKRAGFARSEPAQGLTRVRMKLNQSGESIESSEATRARQFSDTIAQRSKEGYSGMPGKILEREDGLVSKIASLRKERAKTDKEKAPEKYENLTREIERTEIELKKFVEMLWKDYKPYAAVKYPRPVTLKESALRADECAVIFDVSSEGVGVKLIRGKEIAETFYKKWKLADLESDIQRFRQVFERVKLNEFDPELAQGLYQKLLSRVLDEVPKGTPLVIIPDGVLAVLPFEALVTGGKASWKKGPYGDFPQGLTYLGDDYPISYYQSITALTLARSIGEKKARGERLLVMADPVFQMRDDRAQSVKETKVARQEREFYPGLMVAIEEGSAGQFKFARLPETAALAKTLQDLYGSKSDIRTDEKANKSDFLSKIAPKLDQYREIVFATHGLFSTKIPGIMEPFLALTMVPPGTDGFLKMSDVMALKMNADLVALTACQTGIGKELSGEGVMSMGRAFQYAGAKSVLMSLWSVAEKSSIRLVESFFKNRQAGKDKLQSLKLARDEIRKAGFDHPFFWAPFILVGEVN